MQMVGNESAIFTADLEWDSTDPQAIKATFHAANGDTAWVFARDLVQRAYTFSKAGEGDVRVVVADGYLVLTLDSPDGTAEARTKSAAVANFMARTYTVVSSADESDAYDTQVDRALDHFFREPS